MRIVKFWVCGWIALCYKPQETNRVALAADAAYRLQAQGTPEKKLDIYG